MAFGGVVAPIGSALAATTGKTGGVTITQASNPDATYDGYHIVKADVDASDNGSRFEWANDTVKAATLNFLKNSTLAALGTGVTQTYNQWIAANHGGAAVNGVEQSDLPQNAVEYIAAQVEASNVAQNTSTNPATKQQNTFADNFAQALKAANVPIGGVASTGVQFVGAQGYWLFSTTGVTLAADEAGTAPIFVALGDTAKDVEEKSSAPTVDKKVKEDKSGTFGKVADGAKGQDLSFQITATLPTGIDSYDFYHLEFEDQLPAGMSLKGTSTADQIANVKVTVYPSASAASGVDITEQLTGTKGGITYANDKLDVNIADLRKITGISAITKDMIVRVDYDAHCDADAVIGQAGNDNVVTLVYTNDPQTRGDGRTSPNETAKVATYKLQVVKVDSQTREALQGAKFTIQAAEAGQTDAASVGKYVQQDGSLGDSAYEFTTGADGTFTVERIDEGVYTVHETAAPNGYELLSQANGDSDVTITIAATKDQSAGTVTALTMTATGGNGPDGMAAPVSGTSAVADDKDGVLEAAVATGSLRFRVSNDKEIHLPGTGLTPSAALTVASIAFVGIGIVGLQVRRRNKLEA
jgi:fimbrial isopeptide formation D2 family protein